MKPSRHEPEVRIVLFGPGEVLRGKDGTFRRVGIQPKVFALLVRLALSRHADFVRRDALLALLWPDVDATKGRNALSQAIHRLRRDLGAGVLITHAQEEVGLARHVWCDVRHFRAALERDDAATVLDLYRAPLLDAFHVSKAGAFTQWLDLERRATRQAAWRAALTLADRAEAGASLPEASRWLRRAVEISPADDVVLCRLIRMMQRIGDRAGAIRAYESAAARLWVELELEPASETRALIEELRNGRHPASPEARRAFLRGRHMSSVLGQVEAALANFQRAVTLDPEYAAAHAGVAECLATLAVHGHLSREQAALPLETSARRAIEQDSELSEPHVALAIGRLVFARDWMGAEQAFRRAVELDPLNARARSYLAFYLSTMGWLEEGVAEARRAAELDPLDSLANFMHAFALYRARDYATSLEHFRALVELQPHHALAHMFIAENELRLGRGPEAIEAARVAAGILPEDPLLTGICACILGFAGDGEQAETLLHRLKASARHRYVNPHFLASAHAGLGQLDQAFAYWQCMIQERAPGAFLIRTDPLFEPLRSDARFQHLLELLHFPRVPGLENRTKPRRF